MSGRTQAFTVPGRFDGLNEYTRACRQAPRIGAAMKRENQARALAAIRAAGVERCTSPVWVTFRWVERNGRRDKDNVAFAKKFVLDALVEAGVLEDDGGRWVAGFTDVFAVNARNPRVEVELTEVGEGNGEGKEES